MKTLLASLTLFVTTLVYALPANLNGIKVEQISIRDTGAHTLIFNSPVPDQGCTLSDRGMVTGDNGSTLMELAYLSFSNGNTVNIRVDGCVAIGGPTSGTAPRIVKIKILSNN